MPGLQIPRPHERALVAAADLATSPLAWFRRRGSGDGLAPRRVLLLRLERIGDLLMILGAVADARAAWPGAEIDLAVGSWNEPLARLIPGVSRVLTADVPWLARESDGDGWLALARKARQWAPDGYDLAVNFEPDIRSNALVWLTGARRRVGYWTGGGGAFLTDALAYEPASHVSENARSLVAHAAGSPAALGAPGERASRSARLVPPPEAATRGRSLLAGSRRPFVGVHVGGGRPSKQWHLSRFADVARALHQARGATIVLTGSPADSAMVAEVAAGLAGVPIVDAAGALDLPGLAALLGELDVLVTGDTGPMHVASAVDTPVVALFGPADPRRYGPTSSRQRVIRVDLPCSPCGMVRLPPERCRGHVPDCMDGIRVDMVVAAALEVLDGATGVRQTAER